MGKRFKNVYATEEEWERWRGVANGNLNGWIRAALNAQVELDLALRRLERAESGLSDNPEPCR